MTKGQVKSIISNTIKTNGVESITGDNLGAVLHAMVDASTTSSPLQPDSISSSKKIEKKPCVVLTFDDGYTDDYTQIHNILQSHNVRGCFYVNKLNVPGKLNDEQVIEMASYGHEFGSHTLDHTSLAKEALNKNISIGDTSIEILNGYSGAGFSHIKFDPSLTLTIHVGEDDNFKTFKVRNGTHFGAYSTYELVTPSTVNIAKPSEAWFDEDSVAKLVLPIKSKLNDLGVECLGVAYPYGSASYIGQKEMQKHFSYGRNATIGSGIKAFGGLLNGQPTHFDQYQIPSAELIEVSDVVLDEKLNEIIANKSMLCVLGHSYIGAALHTKLNNFITAVKAKGIEIVTMSEALTMQGNVENLGDSRKNAYGGDWGGITLLPPEFFSHLQNIEDYPHGISIMRVYDAGHWPNYPSAGTLYTIQSSIGKYGNGITVGKHFWTHEFFVTFENNTIYARKRDSNTGATPWVCLTLQKGTSFPVYPTPQTGDSFFRTDLKKTFHYISAEGWYDAMGNLFV